jgi:hypothetical protein
MSTLETYHYKIGIKLDCLEQVAHVLGANDQANMVERIRINYTDAVSPALADYYKTGAEEMEELYLKHIAADNTIEKMDKQYAILEALSVDKTIVPKFYIKPQPSEDPLAQLARDLEKLFIKNNPEQDVSSLLKIYKDHQIVLTVQKLHINTCSVCGSNMTIFPETSEMRCDSLDCGQIITLYGIVFEDSQFYNQQTVCTKSKKYDPNGHLSKWIDTIQAKEDHQFSQDIIAAIDAVAVREYSRDGRIRPMTNIRCETVRKWLQKARFTNAYNHAPLLRKIITGMHGPSIAPPELSPEERQDILVECSLSLREYETAIRDPDLLRRIEKDRVSNKCYYPYILWQIIKLRIKDPSRRRHLLECIHLQSDKTLRNNDIIWKVICNKRGYNYHTATSF